MRAATSRNLVAIDFEIADYEPDSACAIGIIKITAGKVVSGDHFLIRPPRRDFVFTYIHGISWAHVHKKPTFSKLWPVLEPILRGADYILAHNASFDRRVLRACCAHADIPFQSPPFICTVNLARKAWSIYPTKLPDVCSQLGIALNHHDAGSDAAACANIGIAALELGFPIESCALAT